MEKVFVIGGTGFIGTYLLPKLLENNFETLVLVRKKEKIKKIPSSCIPILGDPTKPGEWMKYLKKVPIIINLAGQNIFGRWTEKYKKLLWESRILSTRNIVQEMSRKAILVNASAVGYYGDKGDFLVTEETSAGDDFLAKLCQAWEKEALKAKEKGVKVIIMRIGIVLGKGGMLSKILPIFKLGIGGPLGNGKQWFSWIHIDDLASALIFLLRKEKEGIYNFVSPKPVTNKEFTHILGKILKRPTFLPVPVFMLKLIFGELANVITCSIKAYPKNLLEAGFKFRFENIESALKDLT